MTGKPSIFISYSTQDEKIARAVRNLFEEREHEVLLLKLAQTMTEDFIMDLLRKEMKARDWCVVIQSAHAQKSYWVNFETSVAHIYHKPVFYLDVACAEQEHADILGSCLRGEVADISRHLRVVMSYARADEAMAQKIRSDLLNDGYEVWTYQTDIVPGVSWQEQIQRGIDDVLERGAFLSLVSANSVNNSWVAQELLYAQSRNGFIIPCLIHPKPSQLPPLLTHLQFVDLTKDYVHGMKEIRSALETL